MATVAIASKGKISRGCHFWKWETLTGTNADGDPISDDEGTIAFTDKTVQVIGTFDTTTVVIQGSNDGTNWETLKDLTGAALSFTAKGLAGILENPRYIRPFISADGGSGDIDVIIVGRSIIQLF